MKTTIPVKGNDVPASVTFTRAEGIVTGAASILEVQPRSCPKRGIASRHGMGVYFPKTSPHVMADSQI
ncbi:MAG: hypothetical protein ACR2OE_02595, partial [Thermomicrobiales bacterium]